jgi:hypothetical protein
MAKKAKKAKKTARPRKKLPAKLVGLVDRLGALRDKLEPLRKAEGQLRDELTAAMAAAKVEAADGIRYQAVLDTVRTLTVDPAALRKMFGPRRAKMFLECIRVDKRAALKHFAEKQLEKAGRFSVSRRLNTKKKASGKQ